MSVGKGREAGEGGGESWVSVGRGREAGVWGELGECGEGEGG